MDNQRREFIKKAALSSAAVSFGGILPDFSAKSYASIIGANKKINVAVMGVNKRGTALAVNFAGQDYCEVSHICDVDSTAAERCISAVAEVTGARPKAATDLRKVLEDKSLDALIVSSPDHWHAPAALMALKADKHVYLEKPCSHNPAEGEILLEALKKYKKVIQVGNQRRSWPKVAEGIEALRSGVIGKPYFGKSWYTNNREPIGIGKEAPVPEWLNWELWQGPAPRMAFKDNYVHYNWHWFWHWGTGEALNNGTHMVDLLRWGMDVGYPVKVSSNGGRYHYQDDWETPDTQIITMDFKEGFTMTWEGRSCNGHYVEGSSVGAIFYGDQGTLHITQGNGYHIYDLKGEKIKSVEDKEKIDPRNTASPAQQLDALHIYNFYDAIMNGTPLRSDLESSHMSTVLLQLGNIAQRVGRSLEVDPATGHVLKDPEAMKLWSREYEPGWEMKV